MSDWRDRAACAGHENPDLWFPDQGYTGSQYAREAKRICRECPVRQECLEFAYASGETNGIWGGESMGRNQRMARPLLCEVCGTRFFKEAAAQRYCSDPCSREMNAAMQRRYYERTKTRSA